MDFLTQQLAENSGTENIDLEFKQVESLEEIMDILRQFPNLKILNLHGNHIQALTDLTPICQLQILDLSNNHITHIGQQEIHFLQQLTALQILNIDLNDNEALKNTIIASLPSLQILNGDYIQKQESPPQEINSPTPPQQLEVQL